MIQIPIRSRLLQFIVNGIVVVSRGYYKIYEIKSDLHVHITHHILPQLISSPDLQSVDAPDLQSGGGADGAKAYDEMDFKLGGKT